MTKEEIIYLLTVCDIISHSSVHRHPQHIISDTQYLIEAGEYTLENNLPVFTVKYDNNLFYNRTGTNCIIGTKFSINPLNPEKEIWLMFDICWSTYKGPNYFEYLYDKPISQEENNDDNWE